MTVLKATPAEETFEEVSLYIRKITTNHRKRYGGDYEELLSRAHYHYCRAYQSYDPARSPFKRHVCFSIQTGLLDDRRRDARWWRRNATFTSMEADGEDFSLRALQPVPAVERRSGCGDDAGFIIALILRADNVRLQRSAVIRQLFSIGWTAERVVRAWREAKAA